MRNPAIGPVAGAEPVIELVNEVFRLAGALRRDGDAIAAPFGLSAARWLVLGALKQEPQTAAAIARRRGLTRQSVGESVARLVRDGLIAHEVNPTDRRAPLLHLTERGAAAMHGIEAARRRWAAAAGATVTKDEFKATVAVLQRLRTALDTRTAGNVRT